MSSARHLEVMLLLEQLLPLECVSIDLGAAYVALGEVTGETAAKICWKESLASFVSESEIVERTGRRYAITQ